MSAKRILFRIGLVGAIALATGVAVESGQKDSVGGPAGALRVGTFDTRAVALAYGRSEGFLASVRGLHREAEEAERKGQQKKCDNG